jgi:diguanylate cyclase (GGDEF)-like protein
MVLRDISERKRKEISLATAASTDPLTGIGNRRAFEAAYDAMNQDPGAQVLGCVAVFDLDYFKLVNDMHGHQRGDEALRCFATILSQGVRSGDVVARIGGEEFAALIRGALPSEASAVCDRIRIRLAETPLICGDGARVRLTTSAGLAVLPANGTLSECMASADAALYQAKLAGRNRLAFAAAGPSF